MASAASEIVDGRQGRTLRSRRAICDACLDLVEEGALQPSADEVAKRAGVSRRSIFNHFADLAELYDAVMEVGLERVAPMVAELPKSGPLRERVDRLIEIRAKFLEAAAPVTRALTAQSMAPATSEQALRVSRKALRLHIQLLDEIFASELEDLPTTTRREVVEAIGAATAPLTWEHLRHGRGLSAVRASAAMRRSVVAVLRDEGLEL